MPKISVVIPCFNSIHLTETVQSVLRQKYRDYEILIVNDGSTLNKTKQTLKKLRDPKIKIINIKNQGVAAARNIGISLANSPYILPLDADDKIGEEYLAKAVNILEREPRVGIVSCEAEFFGDISGRWPIPKFTIGEMLWHNLFFCSSVFRKSDWIKVGGYSSNLKHGLEDWDFWLSILSLSRKTYCLPEVLFYYRIQRVSRSKKMIADQRQLVTYWQIFANHKFFYLRNIFPLLGYLFRKLLRRK